MIRKTLGRARLPGLHEILPRLNKKTLGSDSAGWLESATGYLASRSREAAPRTPVKKTSMPRSALLAIVASVGLFNSVASADVVFWTDANNNSISRINTDGSGQTTVLTGIGFPTGIAVDPVTSQLFWTEGAGQQVFRAGLDGTGMAAITANLNTTPQAITVDSATGTLYWTTNGPPVGNRIMSSMLDGSSLAIVHSDFAPIGLAFAGGANKLFYAQNANPQRLRTVNPDGSSVADLILIGGSSLVAGVAVDELNGKVYWTNSTNNTISWANLDGSGAQVLITGLSSPQGIVVDPLGGNIYWANNTSLGKANLDGTSPTTLVSGISSGSYLAFLPTPVPEPSSMILCGSVVLGLLGQSWRRLRRRSHDDTLGTGPTPPPERSSIGPTLE